MQLRDEVESVLRAWDAHETGRGAASIIDYDCAPPGARVAPAPHRLWVLERLTSAYRSAVEAEDTWLVDRLRADLAYLRAMLGERALIEDYLYDTQGCDPDDWSDDYLDRRRQQAVEALAAIGVSWGPDLDRDLDKLESPVAVTEAGALIEAAAAELEPRVRALAATAAPYTLTIEMDDADAFWAYWLDGAGSAARLRLNRRNVRFTEGRAREFALHEVLGHALQSASYAQRAAAEPVPWVRIMSVHTPYQIMFEGLAQALPLLVVPEDPYLVARVRLTHYTQLVQSRVHLGINHEEPVETIVADARRLLPHWQLGAIANTLADRGADPLLRSYLWSYPAGIDTFVRLAESGDPDLISRVVRRAYSEPLTPRDLFTEMGIVPA